MSDVVLQIDPVQIPLDTVSGVNLYVSHTGTRALENVRGHLRYPASIRLPGLNRINIPRIAAGEVVCIELQIAGSLPGAAFIKCTGLNARTEAGAALDFEDRVLEMSVVSHPPPGDVALIRESAGNIFQNRIGQLRYTLHNNGKDPVLSPQLTFTSPYCDVYQGSSILETVPPGASARVEFLILPRLAGAVPVSLHLQFRIQDQDFLREEAGIINVLPSGHVSPPPEAERQRILLVTAAPSGNEFLRVNEEFRDILFEMKYSAPKREHFQMDVLLASNRHDFSREIRYQFPYLIHFAGHGSEYGIILEGVKGASDLVRIADLVSLLEPLAGRLACVVLNACSSLTVARGLSESIHGVYVVGMRQTQLDTTALAFSKGFYQTLGAGHPIETAFQIAKSGLRSGSFDESHKPVLFQDGRAI